MKRLFDHDIMDLRVADCILMSMQLLIEAQNQSIALLNNAITILNVNFFGLGPSHIALLGSDPRTPTN